ncbi:MAG: FHA domain-containing protein [Candidatus Adiutrix sp.]|jgi:S1-C subfamily serine protease|nr:FHA domain-containing protein [Candidatus Adiutrix sp.]
MQKKIIFNEKRPHRARKCAYAGLAVLHGLLFLLSALPAAAAGDADNPVSAASHSVYRVILAEPISADDLDQEKRADISRKKWTYKIAITDNGPRGVIIFSVNGDLYQVNGWGSAYLVSTDGHWVTNHHVVASPDYYYFILRGLSPTIDVLPLTVQWKDDDKDLAVGKTDPPSGVAPLVFADVEHIAPAMSVRSVGFPGAADQLSRMLGLEDAQGYLSPKITNGVLSNSFVVDEGTKMWQHDAIISGGNSGGPLINECGQVVGTNSMGHTQRAELNGAIDLRELLPELERMNVAYTQAAGLCAPAAKTPVWVYGLLGLAAAFALGAAGFLLYLKKLLRQGFPLPNVVNGPRSQVVLKSLLRGDKSENILEEGEVVWRKDSNGRWYRFDPVIGVLFRDETSPLPVVPLPLPVAPADDAGGPVLRLHSDRFADIALKPGQSALVGSDKSRVQICIPDKLISRTHLKVANQDGRILVEDMGSTNGVFLNGRRLSAPSVMKPGDVLSLSAKPGLAEYRLAGAGPVPGEAAWTAAILPQFLGARAVPVGPNRPVTIGKAGDNTITVADPVISSRHCTVSVTADGRIEVRDEHSRNGTFIEGQSGRIGSAVVAPGQSFYLVKPVYGFKLVGM